MAESGLWSFLKESAKQIFKDIPADAIALWGYHTLFGRVKGKLDDPGLGVDLRAEVEIDMLTLERTGKSLANIRKWHKQANENQFPYSEYDFMMLLAKIPRADREGVYVAWDGLKRYEFIQRLDAINHDYLTQKGSRAWFLTKPYLQQKQQAVKIWAREQALGIELKRHAQLEDQKRQGPPPTLGSLIKKAFGVALFLAIVVIIASVVVSLTSR